VSIRPWYCCLSLKVVGVDEVVLGFLLQGLGQGGSTELKASMLSRVICILYNAEALRGDGAGAFTIYALHTCYPWRVRNLGSVTFVSQYSICLWRLARFFILLIVMCCLLYWKWSDKIDLPAPYLTVACALDIILRISRLHVKMNFVPDMLA